MIYQIPGSVHKLGVYQSSGYRGMILVVSPLLSLISNQWHECQKYGVAAHYLTGSTVQLGILGKARDAILAGKCQIVFATPEQAIKDSNVKMFQELYNLGLFSAVAIDEAHCASEWGHAFRPDYLQLRLIRQRFPRVPILAQPGCCAERRLAITRSD